MHFVKRQTSEVCVYGSFSATQRSAWCKVLFVIGRSFSKNAPAPADRQRRAKAKVDPGQSSI